MKTFADSAAQFTVTDSLITDVLDNQTKSATTILVDNYYQSSDSTTYGVEHQTVASFTRNQTILGIGFDLGGSLFLFDGTPDLDRSGLTFSFDRNDYLDQLPSESGFDLVTTELDRLSSVDERLLLARYSQFFDEYVAFTQTNNYQALYHEAIQVADSLRGYVADEFDERSKKLIAIKEQLDRLSAYQDAIIPRLQGMSADLQAHARVVIDSAYQLIEKHRDRVLLHRLRATEQLSGLQRLLLATKNFSLGNTRLANNGNTSIGLPIRGINYSYERNGITATAVYGSRIVSRRFTPREGIAFHDLYKDLRVGQFGLGYQTANSQYELSVISSTERGSQRKEEASTVALPRSNRVISFSGQSAFGPTLSLLTSVSHARTLLKGTNSGTSDDQSSTSSDLDLRAGFELTGHKVTAALTAFRTGSTFRSFANPYLYTDYQGVETTISAAKLWGLLDASFSLAGGFGTTEQSKNDFRLRAQGQFGLQISKSSSVILVVSPNVYRYSVTGKEGLSESSVYNLIYQLNTKAFGQPAYFNIGATNLNQGITWADSTTVSSSLIGTATGAIALGEGSSLSFDAQHSFSNSDPQAGTQYNYGIKATRGKKVNVGLGINYGVYAFERTPSWAGNCDVLLPLAKWATVRLNVYYRPVTGQQDGPTSIPQLFSQQSWQATF